MLRLGCCGLDKCLWEAGFLLYWGLALVVFKKKEEKISSSPSNRNSMGISYSPVSSPARIIQNKTRNFGVHVGCNFDQATLEGQSSLCLERQHLNTLSLQHPDCNSNDYKCRKWKCRCFSVVMTSPIKQKDYYSYC